MSARGGPCVTRVVLYGGARHSFTHTRAAQACRPGLEYHGPSAEHAWRTMLDLFSEVLGPRQSVRRK